MSISPNDTLARQEQLAQRTFENRALVITAGDGLLHRFDEVGTFIWDQLQSPTTVAAICRAVADHFNEFDESSHQPQILAFIEALQAKGLVKITPDQ